MKKLRVVIPLALAVIGIMVISLNVAFAQGEQGERDADSGTGSLATKVAEILGLDAVEVGSAIKQAREELRDEALKKKIDGFVQRGRITQKQADEYLEWIQSRPIELPEIRKHSFGKQGRENKSFGPGGHFKKGPSFEEIEKKLKAMVESGDITQEEADEKLRGSYQRSDQG